MQSTSFSRGSVIGLAVAVEGGLALLAALLAWWAELPWADKLRGPGPALGWGVAATLPMCLAMWTAERVEFPPFVRLRKIVDQFVVPLFASCSHLDLLLISMLAGLGEEALFRGVIQERLHTAAGPFWAIAVASILFGLAHLITPTYAVLATGIGVYLGWLYFYFDSLLVPMTAHALYDFVALVYLTRRKRMAAMTGAEETTASAGTEIAAEIPGNEEPF
jgi:hypothetical protein